MNSVLIHFPSVQSQADGTFDASVWILCIGRLLKGFERMRKNFNRMTFTLSFITNPLQAGDISEIS
jgi:hypothetical protein